MRERIVRMVLWVGAVFVLVGIPAISAVAEGPGMTPWEPPQKPGMTATR